LPTSNCTRQLGDIQGWIIDMDGVLYRDTEPIQGAAEFIECLQEEKTPFVLLTNNSTKTPRQYIQKLSSMGINVAESQVLTSALATASYLSELAEPGARIYAIGDDGLREALTASGFSIERNCQHVSYVVVGMDRNLTFQQLQDATLAIRNGATFIGTNPDRTLPTPIGEIPGNGAILSALQAATDVEPIIIGKPQSHIFRWALSRLGLSSKEAACLGDRLETDVLGGTRAGLFTVFVLCGVSTEDDLACFEPKPDAVFPGPLELLAAWRTRR